MSEGVLNGGEGFRLARDAVTHVMVAMSWIGRNALCSVLEEKPLSFVG